MEKKKLIYFALGLLCVLPSCSQEEPVKRDLPGDSNRIFFRSYLPALIQSRAGVVSTDNFNTCQVTCFSPDDATYIDQNTGEIKPYFSDIKFEKGADGLFVAQAGDNCIWPDANSKLHFFAYYPSVDSMKKVTGDTLFNLVNVSKLIDGKTVFDYRLERFRVASDIADQVDFLTAYSYGSASEDGTEGIALNFKHQLARVELSAWGANDKYDFEIAGVRIGNPTVEGNFNLSAHTPTPNNAIFWQTASDAPSTVEHIFTPGETIVSLSKKAGIHTSDNDVVSIMGNAGPAMVIPMTKRTEAWEGKGDPATAIRPYSTTKMYFSVLLRVKNMANVVAYPYPNDRDGMAVIYFAVGDGGKIVERLYNIDGEYYTSVEKNDEFRYIPNETEEVRAFGWASLPVAAKWEAGKIYTYKLNYSNGIGWHDPSDPTPGEPIIERGQIPFDISVEEWIPADDYNSELDVPKR